MSDEFTPAIARPALLTGAQQHTLTWVLLDAADDLDGRGLSPLEAEAEAMDMLDLVALLEPYAVDTVRLRATLQSFLTSEE